MSNFSIFKENLKSSLIIAKKPLVFLEAFDFQFVEDMVKDVTKDSSIDNNEISVWDDEKGSYVFNSGDTPTNRPLIDAVQDFSKPNTSSKLLIARTQHSTFDKKHNENQSELIASLQNFVYYYNGCNDEEKKTILLVAPYKMQIEELGHLLVKYTMPLPDREDIRAELGFDMVNDSDYGHEYRFNKYRFSPSYMRKESFSKNSEELVNALLGMHIYDIRSLLQTIQAEDESIRPYDAENGTIARRVLKEKKQIVKNSGLLEVVDVENRYEEKVGNIQRLAKDIEDRKKFIDGVLKENHKLPLPKGVLLVGEPGCGKSESAKAIASILKMPLLRLNMGSLLGQFVGQSENNFLQALRVADAAQPCVLWIDEIEKAFAGTGKSSGDSDIVMTRIIGSFLTWMQDHKTLVFLVATANDLTQMKDEFLRKGRWDEIYYLSKPDRKGKIDILKAILRKNNLKLSDGNRIFEKNKDFDSIVDMMGDKEMSGADIESAVINTLQSLDNFKLDDDNNYLLPVKALTDRIEGLIKQKKTAEKDRLRRLVEKGLLKIKLREGKQELDNQRSWEKLLNEYFKEQTGQDKEDEFKAKGYISASDLN